MKTFFKVITNAFEMIVSQEDGANYCRILKDNEIDNFEDININEIEDDSSWDVVETTIAEIIQDSENEIIDASNLQLHVVSPTWRIVGSNFKTIESACNWIKSNYSYKEWLESELSLCYCVVDDDNKVKFITESFNPFN